MFVISKSKDTDLPKRSFEEYAEMMRRSQYAAIMALTDPLMDGMSAGRKQRWHKKCIKEMQRVSKWLDKHGVKKVKEAEFEKDESIEQWLKRMKERFENVLPGI